MEAVEVRELLALLDHAIKGHDSATALAGLLTEAYDAIDELATCCGLLPKPRTISGRNPTMMIVDELAADLGGKIFPPWDRKTVEGLNRWQANDKVHGFTCPCGAHLVALTGGWVCPGCDDQQDWAWAVMAGGGPA